MFVGHYGVSFAARRMNRQVPLWVLFIAVQLLDVFWAPLILLGTFGLEAALLFGGMLLFLRRRAGPKKGMMMFGIVMLAIQAVVFFDRLPLRIPPQQ